jgi:glycerate dehydrogenase
MKTLGSLTVYEKTLPEDTLSRIGDAEAVFTNKTLLTKDIIEKAPNLAFIGVLATGYNVVDLQAAKERNIPICNVPAYSTPSVAQFVFALLLELCHHVAHHNNAVQEGRWTNSPHFCFWDTPLIELAGKTMGIVGFGRIGQATANIAQAFGMKVLAYSPSRKGPDDLTLDEVLGNSDVVSLHCPLNDKTRHIICRESIAKMKDGAILINTARGPLINEGDLRVALISGKLYAAAMDVAAEEPIRADSPLLGLDNCMITPHIAWAPREARQRLMDISVANLRAFLDGKPQNVVN